MKRVVQHALTASLAPLARDLPVRPPQVANFSAEISAEIMEWRLNEDWLAVANAINDRMAELSMTQRELSDRSGVSVATVRELQHGKTERRRSARTLADISKALNWPEGYLWAVLHGSTPPSGSGKQAGGQGDLAVVLARLDQLQSEVRRLADAVDRLAAGKQGR